MSAGAGAARPERVPALMDLDLRLRPQPMSERDHVALLRAVESEHSAGGAAGLCSRCRTRVSKRRPCPSAVVARAIRERKPLPEWLAHLSVPGVPARSRETRTRQDTEDATEGLFPAPERTTRRTA